MIEEGEDVAQHQRHRTPFSNFLRDMANAGVQFYEANMDKRTINYTSGKLGESYVEAIPAVDYADALYEELEMIKRWSLMQPAASRQSAL